MKQRLVIIITASLPVLPKAFSIPFLDASFSSPEIAKKKVPVLIYDSSPLGRLERAELSVIVALLASFKRGEFMHSNEQEHLNTTDEGVVAPAYISEYGENLLMKKIIRRPVLLHLYGAVKLHTVSRLDRASTV